MNENVNTPSSTMGTDIASPHNISKELRHQADDKKDLGNCNQQTHVDTLVVQRSLGCLSEEKLLRKCAIRVASSLIFDVVLLVACIVNYALQCMYQPLRAEDYYTNELAAYGSFAYTILLTVQCLFKILAFGLLLHDEETFIDILPESLSGLHHRQPKHGSARFEDGLISDESGGIKKEEAEYIDPYLRDPWNVFEACIIIMAWISFIQGLLYGERAYDMLRMVILLTPMYTIPAFKRAVEPLLQGIPQLTPLVLISTLALATWTTASLQLYMTVMHNNCFYTTTADNGTVTLLPFGDTPGNTTPSSNNAASGPGGQLCTQSKALWNGYECPSPVFGPDCGNADGCNQTCSAFIDGEPAGGAPEYGQLNFDDWGGSFIAAFAIFTAVYFAQPVGYMMEASGGWAFLFCLILTLIGFLVTYNLTTIIIIDAFNEVRQKREKANHYKAQTTYARSLHVLIGDETLRARKQLEVADNKWMAYKAKKEKKQAEKRKEEERKYWEMHRKLKRSDAFTFRKGKVLVLQAFEAIRAVCQILVKDPKEFEQLEPEGRSSSGALRDLPQALLDFTKEAPTIDSRRVLPIKNESHSLQPYRWFFYKAFKTFVLLSVLGNAIALACQYSNMSDAYAARITTASNAFTWCFVAEAVIKMTALGMLRYFSRFSNIFDFVVTALSVVSIFMPELTSLRGLPALRVLRLFTVMASLRRFLEDLVQVVWKCLAYILLVMYGGGAFSIVGMHLFHGAWSTVEEDFTPGSSPINGFDNFISGGATVLNNFAGNYEDTVFIAMLRTKDYYAVFYFIETIVGVILFLNLLIATLYDYYIDKNEVKDQNKQEEEEGGEATGSDAVGANDGMDSNNHEQTEPKLSEIDSLPTNETSESSSDTDSTDVQPSCGSRLITLAIEYFAVAVVLLDCVLLILQNPGNTAAEKYTYWSIRLACLCVYIADAGKNLYRQRREYISCGYNRLDSLVIVIDAIGTAGSRFNWLRLLTSFVPLLLVRRVPKLREISKHVYATVKVMRDVALLGILLLFVFAVIGIENFMGYLDYCTSVVCCSQVDGVDCYNVTTADQCVGYGPDSTALYPDECIWASNSFGFDNIFESFATLFTLMTGESVAEVWQSLDISNGLERQPVGSWKNWKPKLQIADVYMFIFYLVCFIFLVNYVTGKVLEQYLKIIKGKNIVGLTPQQERWVRLQQYFLRYQPHEQLDISRTPVREFVHSLVYRSGKSKQGYQRYKTRRIRAVKPDEGGFIGIFRYYWRRVTGVSAEARARIFDTAIAVTIFVQYVAMSYVWFGAPESVTDVVHVICLVCTSILCFEALLKVYGLGFREYFATYKHWFELLVSFGALPGVVLTGVSPSVQRFLAIPRLLSVLRLAVYVPGSRSFMDGLLTIIPLLGNALLLLCIINLIFAAVGVALFYGIYPFDDSNKAMNQFLNWQSVLNAFLMLTICVTGDAWNSFMADTTVQPPLCSNPYCINADYLTTESECTAAGFDWYPYKCGTDWATVDFIIFMIVQFFVLLNVIIAIVLEGYQSCYAGREIDASLRHYELLWPKYDPEATHWLDIKTFDKLIRELEGGFGASLAEKHGYRVDKLAQFAVKVKAYDSDFDNKARKLSNQRTLTRSTPKSASLACSHRPTEINYHEGLMKLTAIYLEVDSAQLPDDTRNWLEKQMDRWELNLTASGSVDGSTTGRWCGLFSNRLRPGNTTNSKNKATPASGPTFTVPGLF